MTTQKSTLIQHSNDDNTVATATSSSRIESFITQVQRPSSAAADSDHSNNGIDNTKVSIINNNNNNNHNKRRSASTATSNKSPSALQTFFKSLLCCLPSVDFARVDSEHNGQQQKNSSGNKKRKSKSDKHGSGSSSSGHSHAGLELKDVRNNSASSSITQDEEKSKLHNGNNGNEHSKKPRSKRSSSGSKRRSSGAKEERKPLLREPRPEHKTKKTLVLDLDETLVHSSFKPVKNADFIVQVEIEKTIHNVYVCKRPGVDEFLTEVGKHFEVVVFTASLSKYADPVIDYLDPNRVVAARLFREACTFSQGNYMKDMSRLGRELSNVLIIDNSPYCYALQPNNAMAIASWFDDPADTQLLELLPWLQRIASESAVYSVLEELRNYQGKFL